ncbi:MAG: hypothetical protein JNG89_10075 [Planctomycetaceae bacterium]|nr:hypothetical protein [Planctomycetaceae bacterium]
MLRSTFFAIGVFAVLTGLLLFQVDQLVLLRTSSGDGLGDRLAAWRGDDSAVLDPPDWLPYSLASTGMVTLLYAIALPKRGA